MRLHSMALMGAVFLGVTSFQIPSAVAQTAMLETSAAVSGGSMEAAKLLGQEVLDPSGNRLGEIQSVIVGPTGKVSQIVLDIGSWLEADKRIPVPWADFSVNAAGQITSRLTKQTAAAARRLAPSLNAGLLTEDGQAYDA